MPALDDASRLRSLSVVEAAPDATHRRLVADGRDTPPRAVWRLSIARIFGAVVVTVEGVLDGRTSVVLGRALVDLIDGQGNLFVVVDVRRLTVGDAASLRVLATARNALEARGGRFLVAGPSLRMARTLRARGLGGIIELHPERRHHPSAQ